MALNQMEAPFPRRISARQSPRDVVLPPINLPPHPPQFTLQPPPPPYYSLFNQTEAPPFFYQNDPMYATCTTYDYDSTSTPSEPDLPPHQGYLGNFEEHIPSVDCKQGYFLIQS